MDDRNAVVLDVENAGPRPLGDQDHGDGSAQSDGKPQRLSGMIPARRRPEQGKGPRIDDDRQQAFGAEPQRQRRDDAGKQAGRHLERPAQEPDHHAERHDEQQHEQAVVIGASGVEMPGQGRLGEKQDSDQEKKATVEHRPRRPKQRQQREQMQHRTDRRAGPEQSLVEIPRWRKCPGAGHQQHVERARVKLRLSVWRVAARIDIVEPLPGLVKLNHPVETHVTVGAGEIALARWRRFRRDIKQVERQQEGEGKP